MNADGKDESRHISVWINRPAAEVYRFASDPAHLPQWAAGLAHSEVTDMGDHWMVESSMGMVTLQFSPYNDFGVLDHTVTPAGAEPAYNPMRVMPAGPHWCEVLFTLRRRSLSDDEFDADASAVAEDLATLKRLVETGPTH